MEAFIAWHLPEGSEENHCILDEILAVHLLSISKESLLLH
jgi:hypothetical protein